MTSPSFRDVEQLSAYLDGKLSQADSTRLEARLKSDPNLRAIMDDLSQTRALLRKLPSRRAPRNFTLTPKMAGVKPPLPRVYPVLRFATIAASVLLVFSFATNALTPRFAAAAPAPMAAYGMGGGGGGAEAAATQAPAATEVPSVLLAPAATQAPALQAVPENGTRLLATATPEEVTPKSSAPLRPPALDQNQQPATPSTPIPVTWEIILLAVALLCGIGAWILRAVSERSWRAKTK